MNATSPAKFRDFGCLRIARIAALPFRNQAISLFLDARGIVMGSKP